MGIDYGGRGHAELSCDDFHTCFFREGETGTGIGTEIETETGREKKDPDTNGERCDVRWPYCSGKVHHFCNSQMVPQFIFVYSSQGWPNIILALVVFARHIQYLSCV